MSYTDDAAEQVVRMSLESAEVAARITGEGAKQVAVLLCAIARGQQKTKGRARLAGMLRSGKELKVFAVRDADLKRFCQEAKKYGVLYCVLKDKNAKDGITDIMVRAEDAGKINRIFERFHLATVDIDSIREQIAQNETQPETVAGTAPEKAKDAFLDAVLGPDMGKEAPPQEQEANPSEGRTAKSRPSAPTSEHSAPAAQGISEPSVRQELREIKADQRQKAAAAPEQIVPREKRNGKRKTGYLSVDSACSQSMKNRSFGVQSSSWQSVSIRSSLMDCVLLLTILLKF